MREYSAMSRDKPGIKRVTIPRRVRMRRRVSGARGGGVRVRCVRWRVGRCPMVGLERDREVRRLKVLSSCEIRSERQVLRVVLALARLGGRGPMTGQPVQTFELFRGDRGGARGPGRRRQVVRTRSHDPGRRLGVRPHRRVAVRRPVRRTGAVVGRRAIAMAVRRRGPAVIHIRHLHMMGQVGAMPRSPSRIRVRLDRTAPGQRPVGAF